MSSEKDLVNPYGNNSKCRDFFKLLQEGPKTAQQLIDSGIVKHPRRIRELATILNMLDGLRVRAQYKKDVFDLDAVWSINVTALSCPLIQKPGAATVAVQTGPTIPVIPAKIGRYIPHKKFGLALVSVREGNNIFLYGPSGSGKTEMALQLAKADGNRETIRTNFHKDTGEAEVIGEVSLRQEAGVTVTEWHEGDFGRACRLASEGKKILFIADEITASPAETCFRFHRVLELRKDGSREIEIHGELLKIPAGNLTIVATSNTFRLDEHGEFPGVNTMNPAFCRRWTGGVFFVDYAENEADIIEANGVGREMARALTQMAKAIRRRSIDEHLPVLCSMGTMIAVGLKARQWGIEEALANIYLSTLLADERERVVDPVVRIINFPQ